MLPLIGPRGLARPRATRARGWCCTSTTCGSSARSASPRATAARAFAATAATRSLGCVLNCRGSLPEAAVYAAALALHQPLVFDAVDRFVAPSRYAAGQLGAARRAGRAARGAAALPARRGVRRPRSRAPRAATRWWPRGCRRRRASTPRSRPPRSAGVPLRVAGEGPAAAELARAGRAGSARRSSSSGRARAGEPRARAAAGAASS